MNISADQRIVLEMQGDTLQASYQKMKKIKNYYSENEKLIINNKMESKTFVMCHLVIMASICAKICPTL